MRILVLNYEFPPVGGGGGRVSEEICRALSRMGHEIIVETAHVRGLPRLEKRDGYTIYRNYSMRRDKHQCTPAEMAAYVLLNLAPVLKRVRVWKPDVVHAHFAVPTGILACLCKKILGVPYVLNAYLGDVPGGVPEQTDSLFRWIKPLTVPIWSEAAMVLTGTSFVRDLAFRTYPLGMEIIPYGIDLSKCSPGNPVSSPPRRLLFAGRLTAQKNPLFLLRTLARIKDLDWTLELIGDGPLLTEVRSSVQENGLDGTVRIRGWLSLEELEAELSQSDVLIMPSLSESFPVVGMMALGYGLAIVGSRIGGLADLVHDGVNGFLVPIEDQDLFEKHLRRLIGDDLLIANMKEQSRVLSRRFDLQIIAGRYEAILKSAARHGLMRK